MENFALLRSSASCNPVARDKRLRHQLDLINGIRVVRDTFGGGSMMTEEDRVMYDPASTYGKDKLSDPLRDEKHENPRFVPNYVILAQKSLKFNAYFRQDIDSFLNKKPNVRSVIVYYFLEDDTLLVIEPIVDNAGYKQGKLVRRARIQKNDSEFYHWKDLNVGKSINIYGINYHLIDCDTFTRNFLTSQGIDVNPRQDIPSDKDYESRRPKTAPKPQLIRDIPYRVSSRDEMILTFVASWNDENYTMSYYMADGTITVRRIPQSKFDDDPLSKVLLRRKKVVKEKERQVRSYVEGLGCNQPSTDEFLFRVEDEVEYYGPRDFKVGESITIMGRQFFLIDCNYSTRKFYQDKLGIEQPPGTMHHPQRQLPTSFPRRSKGEPFSKRDPDETKKKDAVIRQLLNLTTKFRYKLKMDAVHPEDQDRQFILEYNLGEKTMAISEIETRNCGRTGGPFLSPSMVKKPDSTEDDPSYYTEQDFYIGAKISVFNHHFIITEADLVVWNYIKDHPDDFNEQLRNNMKEHFSKLEKDEMQDLSKNLSTELDVKGRDGEETKATAV